MKKVIIICALVFAGISLHAQEKRSNHEINAGYGYGVASDGDGIGSFFIDWTWSSHITPRLHAGLGIRAHLAGIPVYAHFKAILGQKKVQPYIAVNVGYTIIEFEDEKRGLYCLPSVGIRFPAGKKTMFNLGVGVSSNLMRFDSGAHPDWVVWDVWEFRLGLVF